MKNNYCIIMAGGIGSRFWPHSTNQLPKQFIDFFGTGKSLLRMTFERLLGLMPAENVCVVTNKAYVGKTLEQLPELRPEQILSEPMRRNTAPCIAYAVYKIYKQDTNANVLVVPSDHLITNEAEYKNVIATGFDFVANNDTILTLGMRPTRPETAYGYIQLGVGEGSLRKVKTFTEKPNLEMAQTFLASGEFYWNSGMFLYNINVIVRAFQRYLPEVADIFSRGLDHYGTMGEQNYIDEVYPSCPNISIDYGIMEKADNVYVLVADFGWSDLGTWDSLYELGQKDENGNVVTKSDAILYNCHDNIIALPDGEVAVIDSLDGYLVARAGKSLLICRKTEEAKIRQFVKDAEEKYGQKYI